MRVKRLEIQGFKSFKDKTVIHFDHSITGIVGPNGCGKSNIVDAFFWVMGEQSYKHMRGSGSGDLIFNGSSRYTALGLAEVTLVLETDVVDGEKEPAGASAQDLPVHLRAKEISITRRVYREGNGEYFINGIPSRLKDIQELFMDTGVGAKGYSVIEQGQIGRIVNSKPEERRALVEDAAGIAKYKARKKESLRKIETARGNLARLEDVIKEIERNLASLDRQAQKARKHKEYRDQLFHKEISWGRRKLKVVEQKLEKLQHERTKRDADLIEKKSQVQRFENESETQRTKQLDDTKGAEELQNEIQERSSALTREQSALELSRQRQDDLNRQRQGLERERDELRSAVAEESQKLDSQKNGLSSSEVDYEKLASGTREFEATVTQLREEAAARRSEAENDKSELMNCIAKLSEVKSQEAADEAKSGAISDQLEQLRLETEELTKRKSEKQVSLEEFEKHFEAYAREFDVLSESVNSLEADAKKVQLELEEATQARDQKLEKVLGLRSKQESLQALVDSLEGVTEGAKKVIERARQQNRESEFELLGDVFDVDSAYTHALESILDTEIDSLIARDFSSIREAVSNRGDQNSRVAFFLRENSFSSHQDGSENLSSLLERFGIRIEGPLSEKVKLQEGYDSFKKILDGSLVVDSLDALLELDSNSWTELRSALGSGCLVTRSGEVAKGSGLLRLGKLAGDRTAGLVGRKNTISEIQNELSVAEEEKSRLDSEIESLKNRYSSVSTELESKRHAAGESEIKKTGLDRDVQQNRKAIEEIEEQCTSLSERSQNLETELAQCEQNKMSRLEIQQELLERQRELESRIQSSDSGLAEADEHLKTQEQSLQTMRVEEASLREKISGLKREIETNQGFIESRRRRLEEVTSTLDRMGEELAQFASDDPAINEKIESLTKVVNEKNLELSGIKDRLETYSRSILESIESTKRLQTEIEEHSSRLNEITVEVERQSLEREHAIQNLEEKYGPGCLTDSRSPIQEEMSDPVVSEEISVEEEQLLAEEVEKLRERIRRLGEVNTMAIEEYEEIKKRHEHLVAERADLEISIENLEAAIEHINNTSVDRFKKAFEAIAGRFEKLFPIVFGGGRAQLDLVFPEGSNDILEAGVDIMAQPPGKKIVNIGVLSGGEKALTAISLIFAIFMVKPSPFCVLDEVDAPLDDSNIGKFNALLKEMALKTQFILITHNKQTMELNDTLYGVTMEEPGVSKMVSIELN